MSCPPLLLHLRIPCGRSYIGLWLPWFLVYVLLIPVIIILLPFLLVWAIATIHRGRAYLPFAMVYHLWQVLVNLRGLKVEIEDKSHKILFSFT